jgi:hypothetical protein
VANEIQKARENVRVTHQLYFRKRRRMFRVCGTLYRQDNSALIQTWYVFHGLSFRPGTMCHPTHGFLREGLIPAVLLPYLRPPFLFPPSLLGFWYPLS